MSTFDPLNFNDDSKYKNCLCFDCFTYSWKRTRPDMGTVYHVSFSFGQFWIRIWFHATSFDTDLVSLLILYFMASSYDLRFLNQPMFQYNQMYGFSIMNYVLAGLCTTFLLAPAACVIRERQMRNYPREEVLLGTTHKCNRR